MLNLQPWNHSLQARWSSLQAGEAANPPTFIGHEHPGLPIRFGDGLPIAKGEGWPAGNEFYRCCHRGYTGD